MATSYRSGGDDDSLSLVAVELDVLAAGGEHAQLTVRPLTLFAQDVGQQQCQTCSSTQQRYLTALSEQ